MARMPGERSQYLEYYIMNTPDSEGVYVISNQNNIPIYIGRGKLYTRLIAHYLKSDPADDCIQKHEPYYFYYEECSDSEQREKELLTEFPTLCNKKIG